MCTMNIYGFEDEYEKIMSRLGLRKGLITIKFQNKKLTASPSLGRYTVITVYTNPNVHAILYDRK